MRTTWVILGATLVISGCGQPKGAKETGEYAPWTILPPQPTTPTGPSTTTPTTGVPTTGTPTTGTPTTGTPTTGTPTGTPTAGTPTGTPVGTPSGTVSPCVGLTENTCTATYGCNPAYGLRDPCLPGPPNTQYAGCHSLATCTGAPVCAEDTTGVVWQLEDTCIPDGWIPVSCPATFYGGTCP